MADASAKNYPITIAHLAASVAEGAAVSCFDAAMPQSVHAVRREGGWTVIVKIGDFEWCRAVPNHCTLNDHTQAVQGWVDDEIGCPLAVALVSHFHSPPPSK